jgi:hypothetical protein
MATETWFAVVILLRIILKKQFHKITGRFAFL